MTQAEAEQLTQRIKTEMPGVQLTIVEKNHQGKKIASLKVTYPKKSLKIHIVRFDGWDEIREMWKAL
jgi:hypothetical protein